MENCLKFLVIINLLVYYVYGNGDFVFIKNFGGLGGLVGSGKFGRFGKFFKWIEEWELV